MMRPLYVVGISQKHAEGWSGLHVISSERRPIFIYPENMQHVFRGTRNETVIILPEAYIPDIILRQYVSGRNTVIDLNQR